MKIFSSAFRNDDMIPRKYTCDGDDINPPLEIKNVPYDAKSLVLIMHDGDAPIAGGWTHWVVFNIDPRIMSIYENSAPENAIESMTSFDRMGYGGPCPPSGIHHYEFNLYALDSVLNLDSSAKKLDVEKAMNGHIIEKVALVGLYTRENKDL